MHRKRKVARPAGNEVEETDEELDPAKEPAVAKPAVDPKRPVVEEKGPMLGPDGKPLVPQDDPFAKD